MLLSRTQTLCHLFIVCEAQLEGQVKEDIYILYSAYIGTVFFSTVVYRDQNSHSVLHVEKYDSKIVLKHTLALLTDRMLKSVLET